MKPSTEKEWYVECDLPGPPYAGLYGPFTETEARQKADVLRILHKATDIDIYKSKR